MHILLRGISCDSSLPVSVVEDTFAISCDGSNRCPFKENTTALISGQCKQDKMVVYGLPFYLIYSYPLLILCYSCSGWIRGHCL